MKAHERLTILKRLVGGISVDRKKNLAKASHLFPVLRTAEALGYESPWRMTNFLEA